MGLRFSLAYGLVTALLILQVLLLTEVLKLNRHVMELGRQVNQLEQRVLKGGISI